MPLQRTDNFGVRIKQMKITKVIVTIIFVFILIRSFYLYTNNRTLFEGMLFIVCGFLIGFGHFFESLARYRQADITNDTVEQASWANSIVKAIGIIIVVVCVIVDMIVNRSKLN